MKAGLERAIRSALVALLPCVVGCSAVIASNLDEPDANQAVALLEKSGLPADKERDTDHEGHYRISVVKSDAPAAISLLARENLPPKSSPGVLEALGAGGVVPSRLAEQARYTAGIAGDLERSLRTLDGVLSARVHLAIPTRDALDAESENAVKPSASVLIRHRGINPPIAPGEVQRLVAGAVPGLSPDQVNVVLTASPAVSALEPEFLRVGPLTLTKGSGLPFKVLVLGVVALNLGLVAAIVLLWTRLRRSEIALGEVRAASEGAARAQR